MSLGIDSMACVAQNIYTEVDFSVIYCFVLYLGEDRAVV